jgi:hypothetical protein
MPTNYMRAALVEYTLSLPPLALVFDINPQTLSRTRAVTLRSDRPPGVRGYDFVTPADAGRIAQGVTVQPESFSIDALFDATDALDNDDDIAKQFGVEPQLDTLRSMVEPKTQGPGGLQLLASLGAATSHAFQQAQAPSVLLFVWGTHVLPVFLTAIRVDERAHLPSLVPYRANVNLAMTVVEGQNPFYAAEILRQTAGAAIGATQAIGSVLGSLF